jgi:polysaccharide biosynthesis transport protein
LDKIDLKILIKRAWLLAIVMLIGGGAAFIFAQSQPTMYEAQARLMVGPGIDSPNPDLNVLRAGGQLIQMYAELPLTEPYLQQVIDELRLDMKPTELASLIELRANQETQILTIVVRHPDEKQAQAIASTVALRLVQISPSNPESTAALMKGQVYSQVTELERMVTEIKGTIQQLETDYQNAVAAEVIAREEAGSNRQIVEQLNQFEEMKDLIGNAATQQATGMQILQELVINSNARLLKFESELEGETNTITQKLISDQVRLERNHLSQLQQSIAEIERPVEGLPLSQHIAALQAKIEQLEQNMQTLLNIDLRRLQLDQISRERDKLSQARNIESSRQKRILEQIAQERDRVSQIELAVIEKKRLILEQIATERDMLADTQNTLALLYNSTREADPNQVKVIELPSSSTAVALPLPLVMALGALAALGLGVFAVITIDILNENIRTSEDVQKINPGLVIDADEKGKSLTSLFIDDGSRERYLQKYQTLGLHLLFSQKTTTNRLIVVGAADEKVPAGTSALNLAISLSQSGKRVILIDGNGNNPTITSYFHLGNREGLSDFLSNAYMKQFPIFAVKGYPTLAVMPYGTAYYEPSLLASPRMRVQLDRLREQADIVVCYVPDLNKPEAMMLASHASGVILVIEKESTTERMLTETYNRLNLVGANILATILEPKQAPLFELAWNKDTDAVRELNDPGKLPQEKPGAVTADPEGSEAIRTSYSS